MQERVFGEVNTPNDVSGLKHNLLYFGKIVGRVHIELHRAQYLERSQFLWEDFCRVKHVKAKRLGLVFVHDLNSEVPFRTITGNDRIPEIKAMEVGILSIQNLSLFPQEACLALLGLPVPLDKSGSSIIGDHAEGVDTETILRIESALIQ